MKTKDYFSSHAALYAAFRPTYPEELYRFIFKHVKDKHTAWDCATGNGQVATALSDHFHHVYATDISQQQLAQAPEKENVSYSLTPAEHTAFPDSYFDLVTVAQALHWVNLDRFYTEVKRVAKQNCVLAAWGYDVISISPPIDSVVHNFYHNVVGPYWDDARKLVEDNYRSIPFPFDEIPSPIFNSQFNWEIEHLAGYLLTWSSTQKYIRETNTNPVLPLIEKLNPYWKPGEVKTVHFPVFMRIGTINN